MIGLDDEIVVAVLVGQADVERAIGVGVRREQRKQLRASGGSLAIREPQRWPLHLECLWSGRRLRHRRRAAQLLRIADQRAEAS